MISYLWRIVITLVFIATHQNYDGYAFAEESNDDNQVEEEERTGTIIGIDLGTTYSEYYFIIGLNSVYIPLYPHLMSDLQICSHLMYTLYLINRLCGCFPTVQIRHSRNHTK